MPANKNQLKRMQDILGLMKKKKFVNYTTFSDWLAEDVNRSGIAPKTFSRDIKMLQEVLGAPIKYDASNKGFYLTDPNWTYRMVLDHTGDMRILLLSERLSHTFMPPQLRGELSNAVNALLMKQEGIPEEMTLDNLKIYNPDFSPKVDPEVFLAVYQAWEKKNYLKITYSSNSGHNSVKLIEPHLFSWYNGTWYIKAMVAKEDDVPCERPFDVRIFALHRIAKAEISKGFFTVDEEDARRIKKEELFNFQTLDEVEIEFFQPYVKQIAERFISTPEAIVAQDENSVRIRLTNVYEHAAMQLIFMAMGNVRVIKPAALQDKLRDVAQTIFNNMK